MERALRAVEQPQNNSLSIIENVNIAQVSSVMQKIAQFQSVVQKTLREGHDYGVIPGTKKPTLLKPGAEKILMLMGVTSEYELIERIQDYDKGFFAYTVRCILSRNGQVITEGLGHCNTREKKYANEKHDPYTLANTCLKMAKKRAQIDAVLTIASLSEVFTQDIEDMEIETQPQAETPASRPRTNGNANGKMQGESTKSQQNAIHAIASKKGLSDDELKAILRSVHGAESTKDLDKQQASDMISLLQDTDAEELKAMAAGFMGAGGSEEIDIRDDDIPF
ncbi:hypothetical protein BSNK01_12450 [Bacillaceae bacterium]